MNWIEKIRQKPQAEKIRLIWASVVIAVIILIALWIVAYKFSKSYSMGQLFNSAGKNIKNEQQYYEQSLKEKNVKIPDRFHWFK
jgi:hypothetical protein